jgi:L-ascorbate 6-phosphate lactonase
MNLSLFDQSVPDDSVAAWWLCQAGFAFKTPAGKVVYLDPYLSDAAERLSGLKRLSLPPIAAEEVRADLIVLTHEHADHLDPDALPIIARNNPACRVAAPAGCAPGLAEAGVAGKRHLLLEADRQYDLGDVVVRTVAADHGDLSATALSLALDFGGIRFLCTGDTTFRPQSLRPLYEPPPDVLLPCINGVYGNMGPIDAAMLTQAVGPRYAVPCHYGMFAEHGAADPGRFLHACRHFCPDVKALLLRPGERFVCRKEPARGDD